MIELMGYCILYAVFPQTVWLCRVDPLELPAPRVDASDAAYVVRHCNERPLPARCWDGALLWTTDEIENAIRRKP